MAANTDGFLKALPDQEARKWYEGCEKKAYALKGGVGVVDEWKIEVPHRNIIGMLERPRRLSEVVESASMLEEKAGLRLKKLLLFGVEMGFIEEK